MLFFGVGKENNMLLYFYDSYYDENTILSAVFTNIETLKGSVSDTFLQSELQYILKFYCDISFAVFCLRI